jgi:hypothetical protein
MAVLVQKIVDDVLKRLNDVPQTRWTATDLVNWASDTEKEIVVLKPDTFVKIISHPLIPGINQKTPSDSSQLMDIPRNTAGERVTVVDENLLNAQVSNWASYVPSETVQHYTYNPKFPNSFKVFPPQPAGTTGSVELYYSAVPPLLTLGGNINLDDIYENSILCGVMYKAFSVNAEFAEGATNAAGYLALFKESLGLKGQAQAAYAKQG